MRSKAKVLVLETHNPVPPMLWMVGLMLSFILFCLAYSPLASATAVDEDKLSNPPTVCRVVWKMRTSGTSGMGGFIEKPAAEAWLEYVRESYGDTATHWLECQPYKK